MAGQYMEGERLTFVQKAGVAECLLPHRLDNGHLSVMVMWGFLCENLM